MSKDDVVTCDEARAIANTVWSDGWPKLLRFIDQAKRDQAEHEARMRDQRYLLEQNALLRLACRGVLQYADRLPDHVAVLLREALEAK